MKLLLDMDIYKKIKGFNRYQVSSSGKIMSFCNYGKKSKRILKQMKDKDGYLRVMISDDNGKRCLMGVHRIVLIAFKGLHEFKKIVNHKNGIKSDNRLNNLEWTTPKENSIHSHKTLNLQNGENNPRAKINKKIADDIRKEYSPWKNSRNKLSKKYKVHKSTIDRVLAKTLWI